MMSLTDDQFACSENCSNDCQNRLNNYNKAVARANAIRDHDEMLKRDDTHAPEMEEEQKEEGEKEESTVDWTDIRGPRTPSPPLYSPRARLVDENGATEGPGWSSSCGCELCVGNSNGALVALPEEDARVVRFVGFQDHVERTLEVYNELQARARLRSRMVAFLARSCTMLLALDLAPSESSAAYTPYMVLLKTAVPLYLVSCFIDLVYVVREMCD